jgi:hypothetical protein
MVASDFALYGIGVGARHVPWISRYAVDDRVVHLSDMLKRNIFGLFAVCRLVPGVVFCAFVACGWARVSLARFTVASLIVSALYLPLMLLLIIAFGKALVDEIGFWTWPLMFGALAAAGVARKKVFGFAGHGETSPVAGAEPARIIEYSGMPALAGTDSNVARAERIPPALFYAPLVLSWIGLGLRHRSLTLPSAANPHIPTGGMWGESKSAYFFDVSAQERQWIADFIVVRCGTAPRTLAGEVDLALRRMSVGTAMASAASTTRRRS